MAGLPHFDNSQASVNNWEPIFQNQFDVLITPPSVITQNVNLIIEHVLTVNGLPELTPTETVEQKYKFASRKYAAAKPDKTDAQLDITFEVNLDDNNDMYIYNIFRAWGDLIYDPLNGRQGLKKNYVGEIYISQYRKDQNIFREWRFKPAFLFKPLTQTKLDYNSNDLYKLTVNFQCDKYTESRVGQITV